MINKTVNTYLYQCATGEQVLSHTNTHVVRGVLARSIDYRVEGYGLETGRCESHLLYGGICGKTYICSVAILVAVLSIPTYVAAND